MKPGFKKVILLLNVALAFLSTSSSLQATTWTVMSSGDSGPGSLRDIIVNQSQNGDIIQFHNSLYTTGISITGAEIVINKNLTISGLSISNITITGTFALNRMFSIAANKNVIFENMTIRNAWYSAIINFVPQNGGVISNQGALLLRRCTFQNCGLRANGNPGSANGGVVYNSHVLNIIDCSFINCGINTTNSPNGTFSRGGAIFNDAAAAMQIRYTQFENCTAYGKNSSSGGAIYNMHDMIIDGSSFMACKVYQLAQNIANPNTYTGGAICSTTGFTIRTSTISKNNATANGGMAFGGAIFVEGELIMEDCFVEKNTSYSNASASNSGGIHGKSNMTIIRCVISDNTSNGVDGQSGYAGGIGHFNSGRLDIDQSVVSGNRCITHNVSYATSNFGGGIYSVGTMSIQNSTVSGNTVSRPWGMAQGGGIYFTGTTFNCENVTISGNKAICGTVTAPQSNHTHNAQGGGLFIRSTDFTLINSTISENSIGAQLGQQFLQMGAGIVITKPLTHSFFNNVIAHNYSLNPASSHLDLWHGPDFIQSDGNNLVEAPPYNPNLPNLSAYHPAATDILFTNPNLMPLANYGGTTETHALSCGSPARNHGTNVNVMPTDQRGFPRPVSGVTDMGSFEASNIEDVTVSAPAMVCHASCVNLIVSDPNLATYTWLVQSGNAELHGSGAAICAFMTDESVIQLTITDIYGCTAYITIHIDVDLTCEADPSQGSCCNTIPDGKTSSTVIATSTLEVSPNPSSGLMEIQAILNSNGESATGMLTVVNLEGKTVFHKDIEAVGGIVNETIDLAGNPAGIYFVTLSAGHKVLSRKLILSE